MTLVYLIGVFPKTTETCILDEIQELQRQGEHVQVCSLRPSNVQDPLYPEADALVAGTLYVREGLIGVAVMLAAVVRMVGRRPGRTLGAAAWAARWALRSRSVAELARFGQACVIAVRLQVGDHIHTPFAHGPASAALLLSRLTGLPFSFTGHAHESQKSRHSALAAKATEAQFVVANSGDGLRRIRQAVHVADRHKVVLIRTGIDLGCFAPAPARLHPDPVGRVVAVARTVPMKGLSTLVDATALLRSRGLGVVCEIVGDGPLLPQLAAQAAALGAAEKVILHGNGTRHEVLTVLRRADVFVLPSGHDPDDDIDVLPVSVVEAMAVGLPVVRTAVVGIPEVVHHVPTCLIVPADEPELLADALERLLVDDRLRRQLGRAARKQAEAAYDGVAWVGVLRGLFAQEPVARLEVVAQSDDPGLAAS